MPQQTIGRFQHGSPFSLEFAAYGFGGGLNVKDVPQMIGDDDFAVAFNGYLRAAGGFQGRFGMSKAGVLMGSAAPSVDGLARFYSAVYNGGQVSLPGTQTVAQVQGNLVRTSNNTVIGSIGGANALPMTFVRPTDPNDATAGAAPTSVIVICTGSGGPYIWDGVNALYTPAGWANAAGARWCALVNGTVWFGGVPATPNTIYGTGDGIADSMETLPGYNVFVMSYPTTGLAAFGTGATAALVIGMNTGLSVLTGTGPATYNLQDVPSADGVIAGRSMIFWQGMMFYLGRQAVYAFDGFNPPVPISTKIEPFILNDPEVPGYPLAGDSSKAFSFISKNRLNIGYASLAGGANDTIMCFDLTLQGWTILQATPGLNCACLLDAPSDPAPQQVVVGASTSGQAYNWDVEPTFGANATDDGAAITSQFQTKYYKLGQPGTNKALMRLYPELFINGPFTAAFSTYTNYGSGAYTVPISANAAVAGGQWNVGAWNVATWGNTQGLAPYGPEDSRIDFDGLQGEAFSFNLITTSNPFVFGGITGVYQQRGRT